MRQLGAVLVVLVACVFVLPSPAADEEVKLTKEEQELVDLTNKERAKEGLPALKVNPILMKMAREHTANMAKQNMCEHELDGKGPPDRAKAAGYTGGIGENVGAARTPEKVIAAWMKSKDHRENILEKEIEKIGVGIVKKTGKKGLYFTQVFGVPKKKN